MKDLKHIKRFNEASENLNISDVMNSKINNVDDLIVFLQTVKEKYGNIQIMREYEGDHWIGTDVEVCKKIDYYTGKISDDNENVVFIH
jgi:hypothetical protein